jgi:MioC protein
MALALHILVGTMTGNAKLVAQEIELSFADADLEIDVTMMDALDASAFTRPGVYLVCTSTYGQGDVPDNAKALYADLLRRRQSLSAVRYGVYALGDRTHVGTFCHGGRRFDNALRDCGATRIGEVGEHDASGGTLPEESALAWFEQWIAQARQSLAPVPSPASVVLPGAH